MPIGPLPPVSSGAPIGGDPTQDAQNQLKAIRKEINFIQTMEFMYISGSMTKDNVDTALRNAYQRIGQDINNLQKNAPSLSPDARAVIDMLTQLPQYSDVESNLMEREQISGACDVLDAALKNPTRQTNPIDLQNQIKGCMLVHLGKDIDTFKHIANPKSQEFYKLLVPATTNLLNGMQNLSPDAQELVTDMKNKLNSDDISAFNADADQLISILMK
jgi:hypothetical protein